MNPNYTTYVKESLIWNTLVSSCLELPYDINDSNNNDNNDEDDDLSPMPVENAKADYTC